MEQGYGKTISQGIYLYVFAVVASAVIYPGVGVKRVDSPFLDSGTRHCLMIKLFDSVFSALMCRGRQF